VLISAAEQLAGVLLVVGTGGTVNGASLLNAAEAVEVQLPLSAVTV
jgi:hypothetical protein